MKKDNSKKKKLIKTRPGRVFTRGNVDNYNKKR